ncbi:MAG: tetratricopeptide repeat protein [Clostridiaceae bacterium]|jgi:tetratricopeptide (TPR) repeat protein|nr:tetratricopeptide repeat protein [Clostridiaceae bacterium]
MSKTIKDLTTKIKSDATADLYSQRAELYYTQNEYGKALEDCENGLRLEPKHPECFYIKICALSELGKSESDKIDEAHKLCDEKIAELDKSKSDKIDEAHELCAAAYLGKAVVHYDKREYDTAMKECDEAIKYNSKYARAYNLRGLIFVDQASAKNKFYGEFRKEYDNAIKNYGLAIINSNTELLSLRAYTNRGYVHYILDDYKKAIADYTSAVKNDYTYAKAYRYRGMVYYSQKKYPKALADYEKARKYYAKSEKYKGDRIDELIKQVEEKIAAQKAAIENPDKLRTIIDETEKICGSKIVANKRKMKDFYSHKKDKSDRSDKSDFEFMVLRRWNSFTPIVGSGYYASKGGGYFIKYKDKGIVIDPGFNFIENFIAAGFNFIDIDYIMITHAHNDHTADLDSLLTLLHVYNEELLGSYDEYKDGSIIDEVLKTLNKTRKDNPEGDSKVREEVGNRFKNRRKEIIFYLSYGTFKKYSSFFNLNKASNYKIVCVDDEFYKEFKIDDMNVRLIKAKHNDLMSDAACLGFCFEYGSSVLIYTGDTGFSKEMKKYYANLLEEHYKDKTIALVANIGGFKESEINYNASFMDDQRNDQKDDPMEKIYYKNHLGRLGVAKLVETLKPQICIISEFGEEFNNNCRIEIADIFNKTYSETKFLPADIGLLINDKMEVWVASDPKKPSGDGSFVSHADICYDEIKRTSKIYYSNKSKKN